MPVPADLRERIESDPYCAFLGIDLLELDEGYARTRLTVGEDLLNFHGTPHGGAVYSLADAAFAAASNSHGETALALETNVSYLEAVDPGTTLVATAEETHQSPRTAEYEVVVRESSGDAENAGDDPDDDGEVTDGDRSAGGRVATFRGRVYRP